ncbi:MAG: glycosyltransferase family 4 protein [Candidatus Bathyarchaeia archaeon]
MHRHQGLKVAFLTRYDFSRASSRVRVYDYLPYLQKMGWQCRVLPFPKHLSFVTKMRYLGQSLQLARWADVVVLQKLVLQERFIWLLKNINKRVVFDFDDALYAPPDIYSQDKLVRARYKIATKRLHYIFQKACLVIAGSNYLASYAKQFNPVVYTLPSSVDISRYTKKTISEKDDPVVLGWIGSPENLTDFHQIQGALRKAFQQLSGKATLKVVSSQPLVLQNVPVCFESWSLNREVELLHSFDIGLMPLNDTERSRGRCGFKAVQYMAVGLPVLASSIGAAVEVIVHGKTGFLLATEDEWVEAIHCLVQDVALRRRLGEAGRALVEERFSIQANAPKFADILEEAAKS